MDAKNLSSLKIFASDSFLELTEYTREEILGRNCRYEVKHFSCSYHISNCWNLFWVASLLVDLFQCYKLSNSHSNLCRFLQGPETDQATVSKIRDAIREQREITVQLINYTKTG